MLPHAVFAQSAPPSPLPSAEVTPPAAASPSPSPFASPLPSASPLPIPAGVVPAGVSVELAGTVSAQFVLARVQAAIAQAAQLRPGAALVVQGVTTTGLAPGATLDALATVRIAGGGVYSDAAGTTAVNVRVDALPELDPTLLLFSDDPERIGPGIEGVLMRGTLDAAHPVRTYAYHASDAPGRRLYLALATAGAARVQVLGAAAGPSNAFAYVGQQSTLRYLLEHRPQESFVAALSAGVPYLIPLAAVPMNDGELVAAIDDVRLLEGDAVQAAIVTVLGATDAAALVAQPELAGDGHGRRGEYSLTAVAPLALAYAAGGPEPAPFVVGRDRGADGSVPFPNLRSGGRPLAGDYGVLRTVSLALNNPTGAPQTIYLYERPQGGGATTTIWFAGDDAPTLVPCVSDPTQRYLVKSWLLGPGETRAVGGEYLTDGGSSFPLLFGLTATPPVAVAGSLCNAHPAASASPVPAISPTPEPDVPPMARAGPTSPAPQAYGKG